jgi:hypothetical protein
MLSETFWIAFVGTMTGFLLKLVSMAYKSKCKECSLCGCIKIVRDIDAETEEHEFDRLNPPLNRSPSNKNIDLV